MIQFPGGHVHMYTLLIFLNPELSHFAVAPETVEKREQVLIAGLTIASKFINL